MSTCARIRCYDAASVCLRELYFYPTNDADGAMRRIESGETGVEHGVSRQKFEMLKKQLPGYVHAAPYMLSVFLSINLKRPMFQDDRVRKALSMAIDRDFITKEIYRKGYIPAYALVPPHMPNYEGGARLLWADEPIEARRAEARRLLEAAGYGPNKPLKFIYSFRNSSDNPRVAVVIQDDWRKIAPWVQVELRPTEQIHYANLRGKDFDVGDGGWVGDFPRRDYVSVPARNAHAAAELSGLFQPGL
ncbi:MAG: ABC transporter substrate-binding protein [Alphaproteobacteria bacterium]